MLPFTRLSAGAQQVLSAYYLRLRKEHHNEDGTPITTRQIESLIRMAEARARIELAEVVSESHANVRANLTRVRVGEFLNAACCRTLLRS